MTSLTCVFVTTVGKLLDFRMGFTDVKHIFGCRISRLVRNSVHDELTSIKY